MKSVPWKLVCVDCAQNYEGLDLRYRCDCGGTLDVVHQFPKDPGASALRQTFMARLSGRSALERSGVWRYRELVLPIEPESIVTRFEGNTRLYDSPRLAQYVGLHGLLLKHEGENPTGSFKDRGMTVGVSVARALGMQRVACASTGNTSASMASYAAVAGMHAYVFIPSGHIAYGKLSQALAYGAHTIQIQGDFDAAMAMVEKVCAERGIYLLNSLNPFRIEGQKATAIELLSDLNWTVPDWIVLPGGNLGNSSAFFKGLVEMHSLGLIAKLPRLAVIQAQGANPLYQVFHNGGPLIPVQGAQTLATAIQIGNPVSWRKCLRAIHATQGVVEQVSDQEILDAKAQVDASGIGAEPASCATVAGLKKLVASGVVQRGELVCGILTGHVLKDPDSVVQYHQGTLRGITSHYANAPVSTAAELASVLEVLQRWD